jgi:hypothetical protein
MQVTIVKWSIPDTLSHLIEAMFYPDEVIPEI